MYRLSEVYDQAEQDRLAISMDSREYASQLGHGVKIIKDKRTGHVQILNTMRGGNYYLKVEGEQLNIFLKKGWKYGCFVLSLSNYRTKLDLIERKIHKELTGRNSQKQLTTMKQKREEILKKYSEIKSKLNLIEYGSNSYKNGKQIKIDFKEDDNC